MALKYDVIGKINFGSEVNDILKLNGIKDIEGFKNPSEDNVEDLDCLDNIEAASRIIIDGIENKKTIGILVDCDEDGYTLQGLTRLEDGRYVELIYSGYEAEVYAQTVRDEKAYLHILQYEREELLEEPMFHDLKVEFEYLIREWTK